MLSSLLLARKKRPDLHQVSAYKMPMGIPMTWCTLIFFAFTVVIMIFDYDTRIALYGTPVWFVILEVLWRMRKKQQQKMSIKMIN
ncbi:hypothetical protein [Xenorhabdus cabanillasii]|uniref:hypothetical protein n=1 Tax=Xenorhabdus cabanillasii TaxID=351673 RepID=UPI001FD2590A|nr:hypothetical protein [Xenorhabdus cabanillasii]